MKQKDYILILIAIFLSAMLSYFLSKTFITTPKNRKQKVEVIGVITSDFPQADSRYFNDQSVNPTRTIQIGDNANSKPFNTK